MVKSNRQASVGEERETGRYRQRARDRQVMGKSENQAPDGEEQETDKRWKRKRQAGDGGERESKQVTDKRKRHQAGDG
jgi:hypothetical protein